MRKSSRFAALALTAALALGVAAPAFADAPTAAPVPEITKTVKANSSIDITNETYTFTFTGIGYGDGGTTQDETPSISNVTITPNANISGSDITKDFKAAIWSAAPTFPHAGIYAYTVAETAGSNSDITYSKVNYTMYVYVENNQDASGADTGLTITKFEFAKTVDEDGETVTPAGKTAPVFINSYAPVSDLTIAKEVTGANGNKDKDFTFEVVITLPGNATDAQKRASYTATFTARTGHTHGAMTATASEGTITFSGIKLADGESIFIDSLPVGATYTVKETGETNYTPSASTVKANTAGAAGEAASTSGNKSADITVSNDSTGIGPKASGADKSVNKTTVTNNYEPVTPTGLILDNAPFLILGATAVAGIVLYGAAKRKLTA